jgi:hypothetical protein
MDDEQDDIRGYDEQPGRDEEPPTMWVCPHQFRGNGGYCEHTEPYHGEREKFCLVCGHQMNKEY